MVTDKKLLVLRAFSVPDYLPPAAATFSPLSRNSPPEVPFLGGLNPLILEPPGWAGAHNLPQPISLEPQRRPDSRAGSDVGSRVTLHDRKARLRGLLHLSCSSDVDVNVP